MALMKFGTGDLIVILKNGSDDYIKEVGAPTNPFVLFPGNSPVTPTIELWEASGETECVVDNDHYIRDNANVQFKKIVGGRPSNIFKR